MESAPGDLPRSPYPGLSPYDEGDSALFFGRGAECDLVVANLLTSRLTVLYGPSGAGKSSLLRAGVIPQVRTPSRGSRRTVALVDAWRSGAEQALSHAVPHDPEGIVLLLFDQFEEFFLYDEGREDWLHEHLLGQLTRTDVRVRVLISLREDALAALDRLDGPTLGVFENLVRLGPLAESAAHDAIVRPVEALGTVALEPELPGRVLDVLRAAGPRAGAARGIRPDAAGAIEPAYLQLVMRRLWDRETASGSSTLRVETLEEMGGLREIVADHLGQAMDLLSHPEQRRMSAAFHYLVTPSGAKIAQRRDDLARLTGADEDEIASPLEKLAAPDTRILRPVDDAPSYELFHDVLAQPVLDWQARFRATALERRAKVLGALAAAALAVVVVLGAYILDPAWLQKAELITIDARFGLRGDAPAPSDVVIVDLDDASLAALGGGRDRIPRAVHARMIDQLRSAGAAVIAYDFEFAERTPGDAPLRGAIERAGPNLLLAATKIDSQGQGLVLGGPGSDVSASVGYAAFPIAADGAYRQVDESVGLSGGERSEPLTHRLESFATVAAGLAGDPPESFERAWIDRHGDAGSFTTRRFLDVLRDPRPAEFEGKVVVVGTSARRQHDLHATAHGGGRVLSGAEIQANAISTLRRGRPLRELGSGADIALIVILGMVPALLAWWRFGIVASLLVAAGWVVVAQFAFSAGWIVPVVYPLLALGLSLIAVVGVQRSRVATRLR